MGPVIYFSSYCQNSNILINKIRANGFDLNRFQFFNVSTQKGMPAWVKKIPMLVVDQKMIIGDELFALFDPVEQQQPVQRQPARKQQEEGVLDEHDPRARLNGLTTMTESKEESTIPVRGGAQSVSGNFQEFEAYNASSNEMLCGHEELGELSNGSSAPVLDLTAPVQLMQLEDCNPMPTK